MTDNFKIEEIAKLCQNSNLGKLLPNALYVHIEALAHLHPKLQNYESFARKLLDSTQGVTLVKFSTEQLKISYLFYGNFDTLPHPQLKRSILVDVKNSSLSDRDYSNRENPPILHRKETFVTREYPYYDEFAHLTKLEVALGLLDKSRYIGTLLEWQQILSQRRITFAGHYLVCQLEPHSPRYQNLPIERHKAAIVRNDLSRPVKLALEAELFTENTTFFDYGCGLGEDIKRIEKKGFVSSGWDPYYHPDNALCSADIVNLGYIINVIEDLEERSQALISAWQLTQKILIVAAQVLVNDSYRGLVGYSDGVITTRNTFQKYYQQEELKTYIDRVLEVDCIPAGLGIYFVFRDENQAEAFRVSRFHSRVSTPRIRVPIKSFEDYQELLAPLMNFFSQRGRLPMKEELEAESEILEVFGTYNKAFKVILQATNPDEWDAIAQKRRQELMLYLALANFSQRPPLKKLSRALKQDLKILFGSYSSACFLADRMLFALSNLKSMATLADESPLGKKTPTSLTVHISVLEHLNPLLRLYEGCASRTIGRLAEANVIKFHFNLPKITYLFYPEFDRQAHPLLARSMAIELQDLTVNYRDYSSDLNPPILHEQELLIARDYPIYEQTSKLTKLERQMGLLDNLKTISKLKGWQQCLQEHCAISNDFQLYWRKDADRDRVKSIIAKVKNNNL